MPYLVKYIKNFVDTELIISICNKDLERGYKLIVFSDKQNEIPITVEDTEFIFCDDAQPKAVLKAKEVYAERCQYYLDQAGVFSVDGAVYTNGVKIKEMDYDEALELTVSKYHSLAEKILSIAKRNSIRIEILSLYDNDSTIIKEVFGAQGAEIKSIVKDPNIAIITLTDLPDKKGVAYHIFKKLSEENIYIDSIMLPAANQSRQELSFAIKSDDTDRVEKILYQNSQELEFKDIIITDDVAKISAIGSGIQSNYGVAAKFLGILYQNDINVMLIFTTEIKISVVVKKSQADLAISKIHKAFIK